MNAATKRNVFYGLAMIGLVGYMLMLSAKPEVNLRMIGEAIGTFMAWMVFSSITDVLILSHTGKHNSLRWVTIAVLAVWYILSAVAFVTAHSNSSDELFVFFAATAIVPSLAAFFHKESNNGRDQRFVGNRH